MKDLFMCLLLNMQKFGKITAANLYKLGKLSSIELETEDAVYTITITKEDKQSEN